MKYLEELKIAILDEDFFKTNEILEKVIKEDEGKKYICELLKLMEQNPDLDYGMPGPIVHFMEKYYKNGYEELLLESVRKVPTIQTLWMLNRIINDPMLRDKTKYIDLLVSITNRNDILQEVREEAKELYTYQVNKEF